MVAWAIIVGVFFWVGRKIVKYKYEHPGKPLIEVSDRPYEFDQKMDAGNIAPMMGVTDVYGNPYGIRSILKKE